MHGERVVQFITRNSHLTGSTTTATPRHRKPVAQAAAARETLGEVRDGVRDHRDRGNAGVKAGMLRRGNPLAMGTSLGVLGVAGDIDDILVDRQNHLGVGDNPPLAWEARKTSHSASDHEPSFRQTQSDGLRLSQHSDLREADLARHSQTKLRCMACRSPENRISCGSSPDPPMRACFDTKVPRAARLCKTAARARDRARAAVVAGASRSG
jgi:hypothetical protein